MTGRIGRRAIYFTNSRPGEPPAACTSPITAAEALPRSRSRATRGGGDPLGDQLQALGVLRDGVEPEPHPHVAPLGHAEGVAGEAEPGDVGAGVRVELQHRLAGDPVERRHPGDRAPEELFGDQATPVSGDDDAGADGLREDQMVSGPCSGVRHDPLRVDDAGDRQAVLELVVTHRVAAHERRPRLLDLTESAVQDPAERALVDAARREVAEVHGGQRPAAHGVDVGEGVGGGDLAVEIRIVHDRRDVVDGLHEGEVVRQTIDSGVVAGLEADEQVGIGLGLAREILDDVAQVHRTELGRSTT